MAEIAQNIQTIDVSSEMRNSFLEYAYSVIYARALPDARDGLKPVQRRIIYQMDQMGLAPNRGHVKSSRVVGEVMGKLHPHGDSPIYDALVRLAQDFNQRLPMVDGHGNFGSLDDGPAASRYTEVRLAGPALDMVANLSEDVVNFVPNYDNQLTQPEVLPAAIPNLLVNGASGIAVGMATNIAPHNLGEVVNGCIHLLDNPQASVADLMRFIPGPDLPTGGVIVGLDGIEDAYRTGRGSFKTRAQVSIERVTARKRGIVVTELPYQVGPERVIDKIKEAVNKGKIKGISAVTNLTDKDHDLRLVIEVKNGFNPEAVLAQLYKQTPMEDSFGINAVALVNGQPQTLGLKDLLQVFIDHRMDVVNRRCQFRLTKAEDRLHLVAGLLIAVLDIDRVIAIIRGSDDSAQAHDRLREAFGLSDAQAEHILQLRLRRLTKFSTLELEAERDKLAAEIAHLMGLLASESGRRDLVRTELLEVAARHATPRRTVLIAEDGAGAGAGGGVAPASVPLEIPDEPCQVVLGALGSIARIGGSEAVERLGERSAYDAISATLATTARAQIGLVCADGMVRELDVVDTPALPRLGQAPSLAGAQPARLLIHSDEAVVGLVNFDDPTPVVIVTAQGTVKRCRPEYPANREAFPIINLAPSDRVVWAGHGGDEGQIVTISTDAKLLRMQADSVRPQGRLAGGMAGMKLAPGAEVLAGAWVGAEAAAETMVVTCAGSEGALPGTGVGSVKVSALDLYPFKGRATQGVRVQRFLRGEDRLERAGIVPAPARAVSADGKPVQLPEPDERRDASGTLLSFPIAGIG